MAGRLARIGLLFLPSLCLIGLFTYYPAVRSLIGGFTAWDGFNPPRFAGLEEFRQYITSLAFSAEVRNVFVLMGNTVIVGAITIALAVPCAALAAYSFAQVRFRGKESLFYLYLGLLMVPATLTLIPLFIEIKDFGLFDNRGALILPYAAAAQPLLVLLMRTFFEGISPELFYAARIDGAGELSIIRKIVVPLSWPILLTGAVIVATNVWGDYLWPTIVIPDTGRLTISAGMQAFTGSLGSLDAGAGVAFAAYALTMLPLFALVAATMRHFVAGVTSGSGTL